MKRFMASSVLIILLAWCVVAADDCDAQSGRSDKADRYADWSYEEKELLRSAYIAAHIMTKSLGHSKAYLDMSDGVARLTIKVYDIRQEKFDNE